jgi:hypothetical protein
MSEIKRSLVIQVGDAADGRTLVAISAVASVTVEIEVDGRAVRQDHSKTKALSAAVYDDDAAGWRAVRDFATSRLLERAEEQVERPAKVEAGPPAANASDPF